MGVGAVGSAVAFSFVHIEVLRSQPVALSGLIVIGVVLAWSYHRTRDLRVPIIGHTVFNATSLGLALLLSARPGRGLSGHGRRVACWALWSS